MMKIILKQLWGQRRSNLWLFLELLIVGVFLWFVVDGAIADIYTYTRPTGFDSSHIYRIKVMVRGPEALNYVQKDEKDRTDIEDLLFLMDQVERLPQVESISLSYASCFYSSGSLFGTFGKETVEGFNTASTRVRYVTPGFFDVFRIKMDNGEPINSFSFNANTVILSKEMKEALFGGESAVGKEVIEKVSREETLEGGTPFRVLAVATSIRASEIEKAANCLFACLEGPVLVDWAEGNINRGEILIRVRPEDDKDFINKFPILMGERATVNNLYIREITSLKEMRKQALRLYWKERKVKISLVTFVLLNVLFGIIATFWLRTNARKSEIGLQIALGSTKLRVFSFLLLEGVCLLALTLIPVIVISLNLVYVGKVNTYDLPFTLVRFIGGTVITYLLMLGMLVLGIWCPARRASKVDPAVVLHAE